jgi:transposase
MNLHLAEIATQIAPGAHAALLVDQAGWHLSGRLTVPPNITLIPLPAKCPELNPQENVWQTVCSLLTRRLLAQTSRGG